MTKRTKRILLVASGVLFVTLAACFFVYDLEISKLLVKEKPFFLFVVLAAVGEFPIYIGPVLFGLIYGFTNKNKWGRLAAHFIGLIAMYVAANRICNGVLEQFFNSEFDIVQNILLAIASLLMYVVFTLLMMNANKQKLEKLRGITLLALLVSISSFAIVGVIKTMWGRARFRILDSDYEEFTNFLTINGVSKKSFTDDYRSFPSGHTNSASCILILIPLVKILTSKKWINYLVVLLTSLYVILVAISRVCVGAHYASDVLFGFGVNMLCLSLCYYILTKKGWLDVRSDKC